MNYIVSVFIIIGIICGALFLVGFLANFTMFLRWWRSDRRDNNHQNAEAEKPVDVEKNTSATMPLAIRVSPPSTDLPAVERPASTHQPTSFCWNYEWDVYNNAQESGYHYYQHQEYNPSHHDQGHYSYCQYR
ncbi:hypothetical protein L218DRAFT_468407 [Marasmius fiardii PR-910]|nr:hypothetical protein L218DRAFT_468407 [Marasmius fiardii PR-910]